MVTFDRKEQNSVKQLSFKKKSKKQDTGCMSKGVKDCLKAVSMAKAETIGTAK